MAKKPDICHILPFFGVRTKTKCKFIRITIDLTNIYFWRQHMPTLIILIGFFVVSFLCEFEYWIWVTVVNGWKLFFFCKGCNARKWFIRFLNPILLPHNFDYRITNNNSQILFTNQTRKMHSIFIKIWIIWFDYYNYYLLHLNCELKIDLNFHFEFSVLSILFLKKCIATNSEILIVQRIL